MYRKMVQVSNISDQRKVMIFVKYDSEEIADKEWRVVLYDETSGIEETYIFLP